MSPSAMATLTSANLSVTVAHAISFLTRPLIPSHSATTIIKLQIILEANLTALYAPNWAVKEPLRGSGRRCLTFSPDCLPPRPIYSACVSTRVQWFEWMAALGNREFDLFVDPGCVSIRYDRKKSPNAQFITVWVDEIASPPPMKPKFEIIAPQPQPKTLAQQLLEDDREDDDQLFSMIAQEIDTPTWATPIHAQFPTRSFSPLSVIHSRSSSRSSNSSSTFSSSGASSTTSLSAFSVIEYDDSKPKQSRRERARQARVFVDTSKLEVTPYDGGKTTVLTGGVMLGARVATKPFRGLRPSNGSAASWRSA